MERSNKQDWLEGPGDLKEAIVEDVPVKGRSVKVRGLSAAYSNDAQLEATETRVTPDGGGIVSVNKTKMEARQLFHSMVEPKLDTIREAEMILERFGPAAVKVIEKIDELSAIDKEAIEEAQARFPGVDGEKASKAPENGGDPAPTGDSGSDVPVRAGAGDGQERP